ncbi:LCP family protein [Streptomyces sp. WMMC1477]|uniref:LCP family protein n=1 Tax=Streptomyces sp. WMMC1477 TaxID=3015155 RepID=UPI0022B66C5F|nr:LCP family protein [Streptomyces sp. WMMC1477]MCZ7433671.1 LCP family protein [Streptomyces sp. WMMC1477]
MGRKGGRNGRGLLWSERAAAVVGGILVLALAVAAVIGAVRLFGGDDEDGSGLGNAPGHERPPDARNGSLDVLVLGSDSRAGDNARWGRDTGSARSDVMMLVHLHAGERGATVVSLPRDTLVERPACDRPDGGTEPASRAMINSAYAVGGPDCAVATVEELTDLRVDHFLAVDFSGFADLVDALGGVDVTVERPLNDPNSHLDLAAGAQTLDGEQALALVRTRGSVAGGSDLGRIQLQQAFLTALVAQLHAEDPLADPARALRLADAADEALITDDGLDSPRELARLGSGLASLGPEDLDLLTLPVVPAPEAPGRLVPLSGQSAEVWRALAADEPVPASATRGSAAEGFQVGDVLRPRP